MLKLGLVADQEIVDDALQGDLIGDRLVAGGGVYIFKVQHLKVDKLPIPIVSSPASWIRGRYFWGGPHDPYPIDPLFVFPKRLARSTNRLEGIVR